jgi:hypothetical protein
MDIWLLDIAVCDHFIFACQRCGEARGYQSLARAALTASNGYFQTHSSPFIMARANEGAGQQIKFELTNYKSNSKQDLGHA